MQTSNDGRAPKCWRPMALRTHRPMKLPSVLVTRSAAAFSTIDDPSIRKCRWRDPRSDVQHSNRNSFAATYRRPAFADAFADGLRKNWLKPRLVHEEPGGATV